MYWTAAAGRSPSRNGKEDMGLVAQLPAPGRAGAPRAGARRDLGRRHAARVHGLLRGRRGPAAPRRREGTGSTGRWPSRREAPGRGGLLGRGARWCRRRSATSSSSVLNAVLAADVDVARPSGSRTPSPSGARGCCWRTQTTSSTRTGGFNVSHAGTDVDPRGHVGPRPGRDDQARHARPAGLHLAHAAQGAGREVVRGLGRQGEAEDLTPAAPRAAKATWCASWASASCRPRRSPTSGCTTSSAEPMVFSTRRAWWTSTTFRASAARRWSRAGGGAARQGLRRPPLGAGRHRLHLLQQGLQDARGGGRGQVLRVGRRPRLDRGLQAGGVAARWCSSSTDIVPSLQTGMINCVSQVPAYVLTARPVREGEPHDGLPLVVPGRCDGGAQGRLGQGARRPAPEAARARPREGQGDRRRRPSSSTTTRSPR